MNNTPKIDDGGPAFPSDDGEKYQSGISTRDWFAGQAMIGELAAQDERRDGKGTGIYSPPFFTSLAKNCYEIADAMIAARSRAPSDGLTA